MRRIYERFKRTMKDEQGAVMILMAFLMIILLGFTALAVDYGIVYYKENQLQAAVDIAARAGSRVLADETITDEDEKEREIRRQIMYYLEQNGFPECELSKCDINIDVTTGVSIDAAADVDMNFARVFNFETAAIGAGTTAVTNVTYEGGSQYVVDVMFVLDLSGSMYMGDELTRRMRPMALSVNRAMNSILSENDYNRVGIAVFSNPESSRVLLNLTHTPTDYNYSQHIMYDNYPGVPGRKLIDAGGNTADDGLMDDFVNQLASEGLKSYFTYRRKTTSDSFMHALAGDGEYHQAQGTTDTQRGIYLAAEALKNSDDSNHVDRTPVIFVLSDGEATWGDEQYSSPSDDADDYEHGTGSPYVSNGLEWKCGLDTIKTAAWAKQYIQDEYYSRNSSNYLTEAQIYTLGFTLDRANEKDYATYVLNPAACNTGTGYADGNIGPDLRDYLRLHPELHYTTEYYIANDAGRLDSILEKFASTVVLPTRKVKTRLTK